MNNSISSLAPSLSNNKSATELSVNTTQGPGQGETASSASKSDDDHKPSKKQVEAVVKSLNEFVKPHHTSIQFKLFDQLHEYYIQVTDTTTNSVIQTIPSKKLLEAYAAMMHFVGVFFDKKV